MKIKAYAKLNLYLCVKEKSESLHKIESLFQNIDIYDFIEITEKIGEIEYLGPNFKNNVIFRVLDALKIKKGLKIKLKKSIPTQAGLGGGSSDAAAILSGINSLLNLNLKEKELTEIAFLIGSDVPFFLKGGTALVQGVGNKIKKLNDLPKINIAVLKPKYNISTSEAYYKLDKNKIQCRGNLNKLYASLENNKLNQIKNFAFNSFDLLFNKEEWLKKSKFELSKIGGINPMLTGSGATTFAYLIPNKENSIKFPIIKTAFIEKGYEIYV
jgi:4-diphosphocytidyl-2-C-methyl-D-erythritol kinase